jgi:transcription elongation factor Elf1
VTARDHKYAVVTCPRCHRSFVIVARWVGTVRCRYCGYRVKVNLERRALYRDWEDAVRAASG